MSATATLVIPAKAGIQSTPAAATLVRWTPAFAGVTKGEAAE